MNSDFFNTTPHMMQLNVDVMPLASYAPKAHILASRPQAVALESARSNIIYYGKPVSDIDSINLDTVTFNTTERKHFYITQEKYEFYAGIKAVNFNLAKGQNTQALHEAISKALTKSSIVYDQALLFGADGNKGILSPENHTQYESIKISHIDELISTLEKMKISLSEANYATDQFKVLLPIRLKHLIESSLSFTVSGTERIYKSIGAEGVDFNYIPTFVDPSLRIIMSYSHQVNWLYSYTPQVLGQYVSNAGSATNEFMTTEIGLGTTAIHSMNGKKAILVQPFSVE